MLRIEGDRNAPGEGGSGYTQILQSRQKEIVHHLILSGDRLNELRMRIDMLDQTVSIFAHLEEISLFLCRLYFTSAVRAFSIYQLGRGPEGLTGSTVHSFIGTFVNISLVVHIFEDFLYLFLMIFISGADEFVIRSIHQIPDLFNLICGIVNEFLRSDASFFCFQLNLLAMLIGSGLEKYIVTLKSLITGNAVCQYNFIGISDVRFSGCIGNGCGHIKLFLFHLLILCFRKL